MKRPVVKTTEHAILKQPKFGKEILALKSVNYLQFLDCTLDK